MYIGLKLGSEMGNLAKIAILALVFLRAWAQAPPLVDVSRQLGPFELRGQRFTAVLHKKRIAGSVNADFGETLALS